MNTHVKEIAGIFRKMFFVLIALFFITERGFAQESEVLFASEEKTMKTTICMTFDNTTVIMADLDDSETTKTFLSLLPLTLDMQRYADREYYTFIGELSENGEVIDDFENGDVTYYTTGRSLAIFFENAERSKQSGLIRMGKVTSDLSLFETVKNSTTVLIEAVEGENEMKNYPQFNIESKTVTLNNNIKMPIIGIGTYMLSSEEAENSVYHALLDGYRLIDTANVYMNEKAVGRGIKRSGVPREEIFVTTKLWVTEYGDVDKAIDETLERLGLDYIDLLLLHQPYADYTGAYQAMENAVETGKVRSIGLSNFYTYKFDEIMEIAKIPPAVLQVEMNPTYQQKEMREYVKQYGTQLEAWYPLGGRGNTQTLFNNEIIRSIAENHGVTSAQVILRWHLQMGNIAIPGSSNPDHILENISIFDFELSQEEMDQIKTIDTNEGKFIFNKETDDVNEQLYTSLNIDFNNQR